MRTPPLSLVAALSIIGLAALSSSTLVAQSKPSGAAASPQKKATTKPAAKPAATKTEPSNAAARTAADVAATSGAEKAGAQSAARPTVRPFAERTAKWLRIDGYMPLFWDEGAGKLWLEIDRFNSELLYQVSLPAGVGSNPIGLDRGQLGDSAVVVFERVGPRVLMVQQNYRYRALTGDAAERRAVEQSFARSVLWGFKVEASEGDHVLVDATAFFLRDAHGVIEKLRDTRQGRYKLDDSRSALYLARTKGFPKNTEIEATLTFTTDDDPGRYIKDVVPTPTVVTVREHHSFVELPPLSDGYLPRRLDPRVSSFGITFNDYASPITEPIEKRWIVRHHLQKKDPNAVVSDPVKPIVYYVDNGAPEPIRSALVQGASWWNEAFEAAGFRNAFQVKVLPDDADPMDLRYNMINWVHRSTRGWSYGGSVVDPRTGQILKGNVTLGSLRVRQDYTLGSGMVPQFAADGHASDDPEHFACDAGALADLDYLADLDPKSDAAAMSLARIRQLSAHETGHTLGFAHNFAASTYDRASVMDYPAPTVQIADGRIDLSNAYARGIGAFDKFAVTFAYAQFAKGASEEAELQKLVAGGVAAGMLFLSDEDARPAGAAHPLASLWDNGPDPIASLRHEMQVRRLGLDKFGLNSIPDGTPLSALEAKLVPLYLHHRYQLQAAVKSLGGVNYTYSVKTAGAPLPATINEMVTPERQRDALRAVLDTIKLEELVLPTRILDLIPPTAFGYRGGTAETFDGRTDVVFDPTSAATIAADLAVSALLDPDRAARLFEGHGRNEMSPTFDEVVGALLRQTWYYAAADAPKDARAANVLAAVQDLVVERLMDLAANGNASSSVRAVASGRLRTLRDNIRARGSNAAVVGLGMAAERLAAAGENIDRFLTRPDAPYKRTAPLAVPPGEPIGGWIR
jgi:hypothetical protein